MTMTIEEKAKAYDEVIKKAESLYKVAEPMSGCNVIIETLFPEIKESEDEKIRKGLIEALSKYKYYYSKEIAWLKKLGEQKHIDKIEPKFKIGDWLVHNERKHIVKVVNLTPMVYEVVNILGYHHTITDTAIENNYHLWTIQDAKDGDVLQLGEVTAIFQKYIGDGNCKCYCSVYDGEFEIPSKDSSYGCHNAIPATKEQRDLLFRKMNEAGYEWDAEKKELNKIKEEVNGEDYGIDSLYHAQRILEKTLGSVDGYQSDDGILEHKCAITAVKKLYEHKPTNWSEGDESILESVIKDVMASHSNRTVEGFLCKLNWLKSLKCMVQPKQKWSEEDEDYINDLIKYFSQNERLKNTKEDIVIWLKSLTPQNRWKPSDEQLNALHDAVVYVDKSMFPYPKGILMKLYKQLKKLREE